MEKDPQTLKNCDNYHNYKKSGFKKLTLNSECNEEINVDSSNNRTITQTYMSNKGVTSNSNSPKMGSRRIFTPQFKLQVLESYRNDSDCKGNQRATARKYNIHRRQIQKWLQCEPSLRSSVANINHNSVKHQFHNVSMQQQTKNIANTSNSVCNSFSTIQSNSSTLCTNSLKGSLSYNSVKVSSAQSCISTTPTQETHDIFNVTGSATMATSAGAISVISPTVASVIPPSSSSTNKNTSTVMPPMLHNHYGLTPYCNTVPILVHHLPHPQQHIHQQSHQTYYHNMTYSPSLSHNPTEKQQSMAYFPPISLPVINVLTAGVSTSNIYAGDAELIDKYGNFVSDKKSSICHHNQYHSSFECSESVGCITPSNIKIPIDVNEFKGNSLYSVSHPFGPMDLSVRNRREEKIESVPDIKTGSKETEAKQIVIPARKDCNDKIGVVDLTYRKRRVSSHSVNIFPEKQLKSSNLDTTLKNTTINVNQSTINSTSSNEDDDVEIEVGTEEKFLPSSKPVKLFKPYLLDEGEYKETYCASSFTDKMGKNEAVEKSEHINNFPKSISVINSSSGFLINDNNFADIVKENINSYVGSSNFLVESRSETPRSAYSPATSVLTMSPTNFQYPKGSPSSSGYESSTSTYSDSSLSSRNEAYNYGQTFSVNLQMQTTYNENVYVIHPSKQVQRWLEKDDSNPQTSNLSVALCV